MVHVLGNHWNHSSKAQCSGDAPCLVLWMCSQGVYLMSVLLMAVITDDMNAEASVDNPATRTAGRNASRFDYSISGKLISLHLLGYTQVPGSDSHKKYICAFRRGCSASTA